MSVEGEGGQVMKKILVLAVAALLAGSVGANAAPITYDFAVNGGPTGPLAGVTASGHFTFDDSVIPPGGGPVNQVGLLTNLDFTWNGIAYDETTANTGTLAFGPTGVLTAFAFGTNCTAASCSVDPADDNSWFVDDIGIVYQIPGVGVFEGSTAQFSLRQVPAPATVLLLGSGLAALGTLAWRRRR
jgi:hypothetical protein